jgi:hypothetical protein
MQLRGPVSLFAPGDEQQHSCELQFHASIGMANTYCHLLTNLKRGLQLSAVCEASNGSMIRE